MSRDALLAHLGTGETTVCRCWTLVRRDGTAYGFTDHDRDIAWGGIVFRADTGMTARALMQGTGLALDNSEALGVLNDSSIKAADIEAGRFDGAVVEGWLVNWQAPGERLLRFRGTLGEIVRSGAEFTAELRGLTDRLNQPQGRSYTPSCQAILGDADCGVDLEPLAAQRVSSAVTGSQVFLIPPVANRPDRWFERGTLEPLIGPGQGLRGIIKTDRVRRDGTRVLGLWEPIRADVAPDTEVRITPGCDKRRETCRDKFANIVNFRGFPFIPGEDWLVAPPRPEAS